MGFVISEPRCPLGARLNPWIFDRISDALTEQFLLYFCCLCGVQLFQVIFHKEFESLSIARTTELIQAEQLCLRRLPVNVYKTRRQLRDDLLKFAWLIFGR